MTVLHTQATLLLKKLSKLERCGRYSEGMAELADIWENTDVFPAVEDFDPHTAAEIILRCGSLFGFHGHIEQIQHAQETSKDLLTEARSRFLELRETEKVAECENYLALAYWRTGERQEAEAVIRAALTHPLPNYSQTRLYSYVIESKIDFTYRDYEKICRNAQKQESDFLNYGDFFLKGNLYNNWGLSLKNLGRIAEALAKLEFGKQYYFKSENKVHYALAENNLAQLYKSEGKFAKAHEAIDNAVKIFRQIKDRTREGFSYDTKAQIYFSQRKFKEALKTVEKAIGILSKSENNSYLVETLQTKVRTLIYLDEFAAATFCLCDAVHIARTQISEEAAANLIKEYEKTLQEKNSPAAGENIPEKDLTGENLELVMPASLAHYKDVHGVWIKNEHLAAIGLQRGSLAVVVKEKIGRGDLAAITDLSGESVSCGFYDSDFGVVCLEGVDSEVQLFDEREVKILGKIVGVCHPEKNTDGKMIVEPLEF